MTALILCIIAFPACFFAGRRSLGWGLVTLFIFGYFYGILRANLLTTYSHFIFDAGLLGLYLSQKWFPQNAAERRRLAAIRLWLILLIGWPLLLVLLPFQPLLVSLVGLRGNVFFVPCILLGGMLKNKDVRQLSIGLAVLNLVAFGFALAEYFRGVPAFYPFSPVTRIIYASGDVAGGFYRIPAIFTSAHAFGGTMALTLPYLVGLWSGANGRWTKILAIVGISAAMLGVLMSATRQNFVIGVVIGTVTLFTTKIKGWTRLSFMAMIGIMAVVALTNPRFQRFKTLSDTDAVVDRIAGSVNRSFLEILANNPMGNGLGGGGSSMPYFLEGQVRNPIAIENEYGRILAELGIIGLLLWIAFVLWFIARFPIAFARGPWMNSRRIIWSLAAFGLGTAWIGTGMLTSIPGTALTMLGIGWTSEPMEAEAVEPGQRTGQRVRTSSVPTVAAAYRSAMSMEFRSGRALGPAE